MNEPNENPRWHYALQDRRIGPVSATVLKQLVDSGIIKPDDTVWPSVSGPGVLVESVLASARPTASVPSVAATPDSGANILSDVLGGFSLCGALVSGLAWLVAIAAIANAQTVRENTGLIEIFTTDNLEQAKQTEEGGLLWLVLAACIGLGAVVFGGVSVVVRRRWLGIVGLAASTLALGFQFLILLLGALG